MNLELARRSIGCIALAAFSLVFLHGQTVRVLDPLAVQVAGDPSRAVRTIRIPVHIPSRTCDVVILGGGLGGSAAALSAASQGARVCMTEPTRWIGGQMTSQGVSAFDDNEWSESAGSSRSFLQLRSAIRAHYAPLVRDSVRIDSTFNPGTCWVSYECAEATVDHDALRSMLAPYMASGRVTLFLRTVPVRNERNGSSIRGVLVYSFDTRRVQRLAGSVFIDATELGEFLPMSGADYAIGAEAKSETGEADAPAQANPRAAQSFTYTFVLEQRPQSENSPKPPGYDTYRKGFSFDSTDADAQTLAYAMYSQMPRTPGSFWTYRRLIARDQFKPNAFASDLSMINWDSNDVCDSDLLSDNPLREAAALQHAKRVSTAFAWWLRYEAPHQDHRGAGYPELHVVPSALGSADGLSQFPYVREARRMKALRTVREQDIVTPYLRAVPFHDTVGIGQYPIDIHPCVGILKLPAAKPFQIPLGSLLSRSVDNLVAASKNIGTTHITNGAFRVHPTEWAVGTAAGAVAALAARERVAVRQIDSDPVHLWKLQKILIEDGQPLVWFTDLPVDAPHFKTAQLAAVLGLMPARQGTLSFGADEPVTKSEAAYALHRLFVDKVIPEDAGLDASSSRPLRWASLARLHAPIRPGEQEVKRGDFVDWVVSFYLDRQRSM